MLLWGFYFLKVFPGFFNLVFDFIPGFCFLYVFKVVFQFFEVVIVMLYEFMMPLKYLIRQFCIPELLFCFREFLSDVCVKGLYLCFLIP
jgi:hypothetical protein